jgi:excisionase family DNA binding protein
MAEMKKTQRKEPVPIGEKLLTIREAAEVLRLNPRTVREYVQSGEIEGRIIGGRWRFRRADLDAFFENAPRNWDFVGKDSHGEWMVEQRKSFQSGVPCQDSPASSQESEASDTVSIPQGRVTVRVAGDCSMPMADRCSTVIFAEPIVKEQMFGSASENVVEGSPGRNALIAGEHRPEINNSNGVFRVTAPLRALQMPGVALGTKRSSRRHQNALEGEFEGVRILNKSQYAGN